MHQGTFVPSIVTPRVTTTVCPATSRPSSISAASSNSSSRRDKVFLELLSRLAHEVTAGGTLTRATRLQLGRGFVQTPFVISGRYPHQDLIQHSPLQTQSSKRTKTVRSCTLPSYAVDWGQAGCLPSRLDDGLPVNGQVTLNGRHQSSSFSSGMRTNSGYASIPSSAAS